MLDQIQQQFEKIKGQFQKLSPGSKAHLPTHLYLMPAHNGDAMLIEYPGQDGHYHRIWVDGGLVKSYYENGRAALKAIQEMGESIDLMMVSHIDQDHIGGILAFVNDPEVDKGFIKQFWFNSGRILSKHFNSAPDPDRDVDFGKIGFQSRSLTQAIKLEDFLQHQDGKWHEEPIQQGQKHRFSGATLQILSPDEVHMRKLNEQWQIENEQSRLIPESDYQMPIESLAGLKEEEDDSIPNGSSLAFLFSLKNKKLLMLGDAHPSVICASLKQMGYSPKKKLKVDYVKLSHHGSKNSISYELLSMIQCQDFIVMTDGTRHGLPHKEALARIVLDPTRDKSQNLTFWFNHGSDHLRNILTEAERKRYNVICSYPPPGQQGRLLVW